MAKQAVKRRLIDLFIFLFVLGGTTAICLLLARIDNDNNPFAMAMYILAVALIARFTSGYLWGILASLVGTFCVNYIFTIPFWALNVTYPGYPLTIVVMLIVSLLISALTTQIKKQEQLRLEAEREKIRANLLRAVAHDLRTPLAAILGSATVLQTEDMPEHDRQELAGGIRKDAEWLIRVTENLLTVTHVLQDGGTVKKQEEVLEEIIGSAVTKYRRTAGALPVLVDRMEDILVVPMDAVLIEQVLLNLFDNVSAHAKDADRIWLHIEKDERFIHLSVEDNGADLPESHIAAFLSDTGTASRHEKHSMTDAVRNMGIGLSVCRSIIRAHGGEMQSEKSILHGGVKISFDLPLDEEKDND